MKTLLAIAAMASALTIASQASAKDAPTTPASIAQCVVDNDMRDVRKLLDTVPGSRAEAAIAVKIVDYYSGCNDNTDMSGTLAWRERAEIANAALLMQLSRGMATPKNIGWSVVPSAGDYDAGAVGMRQLGDCIVRRSPAAALDLARSQIGSGAEYVAIRALAPSVAPCVPAGQRFRVKREDLRLIIAEPLYHAVTT